MGLCQHPARGSRPSAQEFLHQIYARYDRRLLEEDPVRFPHLYKEPKDQEVVSLIATLLAFGNAKAILGSVQRVLAFLGPCPCEMIKGLNPLRPPKPSHLGHRWVREADLFHLFGRLQKIYKDYDSLEDLFLEGYRPSDPDIGPALEKFSERFGRLRYLFPSPTNGSACKRLNLFLRWMVRPADGIDLGLWKRVSPAKLIIPLDIHVYHFGRRFRLSQYKSPSWRMAKEITDFLKGLDPEDPVKYDFAICHFGMEKSRNLS